MMIHNTMITYNNTMGKWVATNLARGMVKVFDTFGAAKAWAQTHTMG